jgi:hypothetical protein
MRRARAGSGRRARNGSRQEVLVGLRTDADEQLGEVDVGPVQAQQLLVTQAGEVREAQDRSDDRMHEICIEVIGGRYQAPEVVQGDRLRDLLLEHRGQQLDVHRHGSQHALTHCEPQHGSDRGDVLVGLLDAAPLFICGRRRPACAAR